MAVGNNKSTYKKGSFETCDACEETHAVTLHKDIRNNKKMFRCPNCGLPQKAE